MYSCTALLAMKRGLPELAGFEALELAEVVGPCRA